MTSAASATFQPDSDVHISFEDQQKINKFARHNAKLDDYKEELKTKQNEIKNLEEAYDELELADDDGGKLQYAIGEVFIYHELDEVKKLLEEAKKKVSEEINEIESNCSVIRNTMSDLKAQLYAKFGSHINLEAEED